MHFRLSSKNGDTVAEDLGEQVDDPEQEAKTEEAKNANDQGNDVSGFQETQDAINTADQRAQENLQNDLNDLRKRFVCAGERIVSHNMYDSFRLDYTQYTMFFWFCQQIIIN